MRITDSPARDRVVIVSRAHINCKSLTSQYLGEMYRDPDRDLDSLRQNFADRSSRPAMPTMSRPRAVWNAMVDKRPSVVARKIEGRPCVTGRNTAGFYDPDKTKMGRL